MSKITNGNGGQVWRNKAGKLHRLDGPAVIGADGSQAWWVDGLRHREDGPAIIDADGYQEWWVDGLHHRLDGPAIAIIGANEYQEWWVTNIEITDQVKAWMKDMNIESDYIKWTDKENMWFKLRFG